MSAPTFTADDGSKHRWNGHSQQFEKVADAPKPARKTAAAKAKK